MKANILKGPHWRVLSTMLGIGFMLITATGANASLLWNNGAIGSNTMVCDYCNGTSFTIFDNFHLNSAMIVQSFDFTDYIVSGTTADYTNTAWSIYSGDPSAGGSVVASGTTVAALSLVNPGEYTFTISGLSQVLSAGTYYLGTSNKVSVSTDAFERASAAGNSGTPLPGWMQSPCSTLPGTCTTFNGATFSKFPLGNGFGGTDTAFDVNGVVVPEPSTWSFGLIAAAAGFYLRRRRTA